MFSLTDLPLMVFLESTPSAAELRLLSLAAPRARKVKLSSFMDAMATPPMIDKSVA